MPSTCGFVLSDLAGFPGANGERGTVRGMSFKPQSVFQPRFS